MNGIVVMHAVGGNIFFQMPFSTPGPLDDQFRERVDLEQNFYGLVDALHCTALHTELYSLMMMRSIALPPPLLTG